MIRPLNTFLLFCIVAVGAAATSCTELEDPGALQQTEKEYAVIDFDRLEMGSAFHIQVEQSNTFGIHAEGDRRNIDDLEVYKRGGTLVIEYDENDSRKHDTYITILMPLLKSAHFSGASMSTVAGFESDDELDLYLSGASVGQLDAGYRKVNLVLSGASTLRMYGLGDAIDAELSGASVLSAFDYPVRIVALSASGASIAKVTVTDELDAVANGASEIRYRGNPTVTAEVTGSSTIAKD
jgi:hypothetical protein